jgi:orotate phosphoribosyltransferase
MLTYQEIEKIFIDSEALLKGHFKLTSGRHSNRYIQCAKVLQYPEYTGKLCADLAEKYKDDQIDLVVGPAIGGIIVAYEVARHLGVKAIFTERENNVMTLRRGFTIKPGERVLVVEDVITTGGSVKEVIDILKNLGANVVGVAVLVDRTAGKIDLGVRTESLLSLEVESYLPEDCPLCKSALPLVKPGSRKE